jgi:hypothetical protein
VAQKQPKLHAAMSDSIYVALRKFNLMGWFDPGGPSIYDNFTTTNF